MRQGYFCVDPDSTQEHPVFNRTVALNSSWEKKNNPLFLDTFRSERIVLRHEICRPCSHSHGCCRSVPCVFLAPLLKLRYSVILAGESELALSLKEIFFPAMGSCRLISFSHLTQCSH